MNASDFYDLVSGRRRGVGASLARGGLALAEGPYRAVVWWRNRRYDTRPALAQHAQTPVVSVGNLTLGGTGKTPMVKWVARRLRRGSVRVAIVSRGYGAAQRGSSDEGLELEHALPDVPHLENADRVAAAQLAADELASQVVVLDDGFQHRRLARDLDIVLLDATAPFGFGHVFPRGSLREPASSLRRAHAVVLTRADLVEEPARAAVRERVARLAPRAVWAEAVAEPTSLVGLRSEGDFASSIEAPLETLRGARVAAFCGLGNPAVFRRTLERLGAEVAWFGDFPDHHPYGRADVERIERGARESGASAVVTTHKDLVKVAAASLADLPLWGVTIEARFTVGEELVASLVDRVAARVPAE
ncbi:MAG: tetraacyldisaccharide 4'-kinase [Lacipirellulaceae bacterium]